MTEGAGLRQSHFGSGYDAGKARLQAEVEQLKAQVAAQSAEIQRMAGAMRESVRIANQWPKAERAYVEQITADLVSAPIRDVLSRLDAADAGT